jgi:S-adenosylmethionine hydrolase
LTDFGTRDYYVGAMKGAILSINPDARPVDITHDIEPQNIASAAFVLSACYRDFPPATIFVCVVDPGVGSERGAIVVESNDHKFVGPDNGLFSFILGPNVRVTAIENEQFFRKPVSSTFHGRDIFAPVAAHLSRGIDVHELGPEINDAVMLPNIRPKRTDENTIEGSVIHIDHFGNIVTNITAEMAGDAFQLEIGGRLIGDRREFYAGAEPGKLFTVQGSAGFIEISINGGSAAEKLGVKTGAPVVARLN